MTMLANLAITGAVSAQTTAPVQFRDGVPESCILQANFTYGSGGTSADGYVQMSVDDGATWFDVANFHFTTASAIKLFNLSALTPVTTPRTPSDGSLASNTANDGILGPSARLKYTTVGTYAGGTTLRVDAAARGRLTLR